jgi:hypothetical protein
MGAFVRMVNFQQEHADVSESLGRRLREEAEVNAALSQVSATAMLAQERMFSSAI